MTSPSPDLVLNGVVRYTLVSSNEIEAKFMSSRMIDHFAGPGTGKATRIHSEDSASNGGWEGTWDISYFEPDGKLAVTPFILRLEKTEQKYRGTWALPSSPEKPVLRGFGFEDDGKLCMMYGS